MPGKKKKSEITSLIVSMRFDFCKNQPRLVGLWVETFGWVLGGAVSGSMSLEAQVLLTPDAFPDTGSLNDPADVTKLIQRIASYDYDKSGGRQYPIRHGPSDDLE